ncbi:hypothetical protein YTPLAS73_13540 [Nitrosarchaeum sp.]|nr:hypothetical protein YTPLAS73_13540 [Nitrosarchaeum sp.]
MALGFSVFSVLLQSSYEQTPDVEIILKPNGEGVYYNTWRVYGDTALSKSSAVSDVDTSGITRKNNSKFQDFKFDRDASNLIPNDAQIARIVVEAQAKLAEPSSKNNLQLVFFSGTKSKGWDLGPNIAVQSSSTVTLAQREFTKNPLTEKPWQKEELVNNAVTISSKNIPFAFGLNQQTQQNSRQINVDTFVLKVYLKDNTPPIISGNPGPLSAEVTSPNGASVSWTPLSATDNVDGAVPVICNPSSGSTFSYVPNTVTQSYDTTVTCTATDSSGNSSSVSFVVTTKDTTPPDIELTGANPQDSLLNEEYVDPGATAIDIFDGNLTPILDNLVDATIVDVYTNTYSVTDSSGNKATITRTVNIPTYYFETDSSTLPLGDTVHLVVEDKLRVSDSTAIVNLRSSNILPNPTLAVTLDNDGTSIGRFISSTPVTFSSINGVDTLEVNTFDSALNAEIPDIVSATYLTFTDKRQITISNGASGFAGVPGNVHDKLSFVESDVYSNGMSATLRINDPTIVGNAVNLDVISLNSDDSVYDSKSLTATRTAAGSSLFITSPALAFSNVKNSDPAVKVLAVPSLPGRIQSTWSGFTTSATIVDDPNNVPADPTSYTPDTTKRAVCSSSNPLNGIDSDGDYICDVWETATGLKIPTAQSGVFYTYSCNPSATYASDPSGATVCPKVGVKDLYVEADYMLGHKPSTQSINDVVAAFKNSPVKNPFTGATVGVQLHVIVDNSVPHKDQIDFATEFPTIKKNNFGFTSETATCNANPTPQCISDLNNLLDAKRQVFRYALYGHQQSGVNQDSSGYAEQPGNDMLITLGSFTKKVGSVGQQSATLMHELGHTLGLKHGGADTINGKPNYPSLMNYAYQFATVDGGFVDRPLDYSRFAYSTIIAHSLTDGSKISGAPVVPIVVGGTGLTPFVTAVGNTIDWNRNGITETGYSLAVQNFGVQGLDDTTIYGPITGTAITGLRSQSDWTKLIFDIRNLGTFDSGFVTITGKDTNLPVDAGVTTNEMIAPLVVDAGPDVTIDEGEMYVTTLSIEDYHANSFTISYDFGDGTPPQTINTASCVNCQVPIPDHKYMDDGDYVVVVGVTNDLGGILSDTVNVHVLNILPTVDAGHDLTTQEEVRVIGIGSYTKADVDTVTAVVDYGDGDDSDLPLNSDGSFVIEHRYLERGIYTITITLDDGDGTPVNDTIQVTVTPFYDDESE